MTTPYVLALDEGTTNAKAFAIAPDGAVLASGSAPVPVSYPRSGWVEQDADAVWSAQSAAIGACLEGVEGAPEGIAISNQRESVVCWDARSGRALGPVLGWQDSRTAEFCDWLRSPEREFVVSTTTGLSLDPMFSAPKMRYLLDRVGAEASSDPRRVRIGTIDSWLVARLTGQSSYVIEAGNASRTLLLDLTTLQWSDEMCALFGVPVGRLPRVVASNADFGATRGLGLLPDGVPIVGVLGDSHAALFGHGCRTASEGKATYGTGSSVMVPSGADRSVRPGASTTLAWLTDEPTYGHEGNIVASGTAMDWTARLLGVGAGRELDELAATVEDSGGVSLVPAFTGLGAPLVGPPGRRPGLGDHRREHAGPSRPRGPGVGRPSDRRCRRGPGVRGTVGPARRRRRHRLSPAHADPGGPARARRRRVGQRGGLRPGRRPHGIHPARMGPARAGGR